MAAVIMDGHETFLIDLGVKLAHEEKTPRVLPDSPGFINRDFAALFVSQVEHENHHHLLAAYGSQPLTYSQMVDFLPCSLNRIRFQTILP